VKAVAIVIVMGGTAWADEPPATAPEVWEMGPGSDLAALGAELTPRRYAAPREKTALELSGSLRIRTEAYRNLDLDAGFDSTGQPLAPVPLGGGQWLDGGDLRLRTDFAVYAAGTGVAVKARVSWLDAGLGSMPVAGTGRAPTPTVSPGQRASAVLVERAWGEALTPFGVLAAGRMGAHFGLGIVANGGDCDDCDGGDAADRIAFVSPLFGHLVAVAWDFTASGPFTPRTAGDRALDLEPSDDVSSVTLAILRSAAPATRARRAAAGRSTVEYGVYGTHRRQDRDVPASYLPVAAPQPIGPDDLVARDFSATGAGGWLRVSSARVRLEAEVAYVHARVGQPSLVPGVELTRAATSSQIGAALQTELAAGDRVRLGVDGGFASGDDAPGFGAFPTPGATAAPPGALDGPQADFPSDTTVDNFRFHPSYHVDQILFREIIGTVTDAVYLRPHAAAVILRVGAGRLELGGAAIASWAVAPESTPSGARFLGVELDPQLRYVSPDGLAGTLDYAVLVPGGAFDGTMSAKPAQAIRLRLGYRF
jgi:uncharacterized protein (TIGR04551 family)